MAELRSYEPTWRERIAQALMGDSRASPEWSRMVGGLVGSTGLPGSEQMSIIDATPASIPLHSQEASNAAKQGNYGDAALSVLGGAVATQPLAPVAKASAGQFARLINAMRGGPSDAKVAAQLAEQFPGEIAIGQMHRGRMAGHPRIWVSGEDGSTAASVGRLKRAGEDGTTRAPLGLGRPANDWGG